MRHCVCVDLVALNKYTIVEHRMDGSKQIRVNVPSGKSSR